MIISLRGEAWHVGNVIFKEISTISPLMLYDHGDGFHFTIVQIVKCDYDIKLYSTETSDEHKIEWWTYDKIKQNIDKFRIGDQSSFKMISDMIYTHNKQRSN